MVWVLKVNSVQKGFIDFKIDGNLGALDSLELYMPLTEEASVPLFSEVTMELDGELMFEGYVVVKTKNHTHLKFDCKELAWELERTPCEPGWNYQRKMMIRNYSAITFTKYQVRIKIDWEADMNTDFSDVRFGDENQTVFPHFLEKKVDGDWAIFWVKVPQLDPIYTYIYMYYGNPYAKDSSDSRMAFLTYLNTDDPTAVNNIFEVDTDGTYNHSISGGYYNLELLTGTYAKARFNALPVGSEEDLTHSALSADVYVEGTNPENAGTLVRCVAERGWWGLGDPDELFYLNRPGNTTEVLRRNDDGDTTIHSQGSGKAVAVAKRWTFCISEESPGRNTLRTYFDSNEEFTSAEPDDGGGLYEGQMGFYVGPNCSIHAARIGIHKWHPNVIDWDPSTGIMEPKAEILPGPLRYTFTFEDVPADDIINYILPSGWTIGQFDNSTPEKFTITNESVMRALGRLIRENMGLELWFGEGKVVNGDAYVEITPISPIVEIESDKEITKTWDGKLLCDGVIVIGKNGIYGSAGDLSGKVTFVEDNTLETKNSANDYASFILNKKDTIEDIVEVDVVHKYLRVGKALDISGVDI